MLKTNNMGQILFTGITVNDLLLQIEQLIEAKISRQPQKENNQSGYLSRKEVAKLLKITLPTLHDWTKLKYLRAYKIGTRVLYKELEVIETLEKVPSFKHRKGGMNHV
jgi:excisionase family DNA binding protein